MNSNKFFNATGSTATGTTAAVRPGAASANPTGAIATAAASVINNTVDNLFQNKVYKSQADLLKAEAEAERMKTRLMILTNDQKNILAAQLQQMNDDNAKEKLLNDMVVAITTALLNSTQYNVNEIYIAGLKSTGTAEADLSAATSAAAGNQIKLAVIVLVASVIIVAAAVMFKKQK